jgi:hypothetical protein
VFDASLRHIIGDEVGTDDWDGKLVGWDDGKDDGSILMLGSKLATSEGFIVGELLGTPVGIWEGAEVGIFDGVLLG